MNFFSKKQLIEFSCTYQPLLFCKIYKEFLELIQSFEDVPFSVLKWPICPKQNFMVQTIIITFIYLLALFIRQNLKKFLEWIQSFGDAPFWGSKWSIYPNFSFLRIINTILIYLLAASIVQNLKKNLPTDPELSGCAIFGLKMTHFPK